MTTALTRDMPRRIAIVGGAGFIGCNLAHSHATQGEQVVIVDNLSRKGSERNLDWLRSMHGDRIIVRLADVRDEATMREALEDAEAIYHMAAQVAVTTSLAQPRADFMVNAGGTLNILEHVRTRAPTAPVIFASTNKVYGCLENVPVATRQGRYEPVDRKLASSGVGENHPLEFRTPYGCSKGAADQYALDYAKSFGVRAAVLRMSCIYGPRQFGNEDQGWVAHFAIRALEGASITVYGDGAQVRDMLHVSDAVTAYRMILANIDAARGEAFNLGGGPSNAISLLQLINELGGVAAQDIKIAHAEWRTGDQPWFVANTAKIEARIGWRARVGWRDGLADLVSWLRTNQHERPKIDEVVTTPRQVSRRSA